MSSQCNVYKLEGGGLVINGIVVAAYYNMFVIIMAIFMLMGGILLTALAYRPKELREEWWEWTERFYKSKNTRIVTSIINDMLFKIGSVEAQNHSSRTTTIL